MSWFLVAYSLVPCKGWTAAAVCTRVRIWPEQEGPLSFIMFFVGSKFFFTVLFLGCAMCPFWQICPFCYYRSKCNSFYILFTSVAYVCNSLYTWLVMQAEGYGNHSNNTDPLFLSIVMSRTSRLSMASLATVSKLLMTWAWPQTSTSLHRS